ncbi:MAG: DUF5683 domain-containing protein [Bacteroidales bacterium]|nr:DUF5683 domain-containing protein [Bacteroidales bacterium]
MHSPQKALILSAFLPGSGQVYNRQYWKAPLYIGGLVATGYLAYTNYQYYKDYKKAYLARTDNDSLTMDPFPYYSEQNLLDIMSFYRRNTELSIIGFSLFYALNILDAYVYAHFFDFSIQIDDVRKISIYPVINTKAKGLMLRFCF